MPVCQGDEEVEGWEVQGLMYWDVPRGRDTAELSSESVLLVGSMGNTFHNTPA